MKIASTTRFNTVDEYLSSFPAQTKRMLKELRKVIKQAAPQAEELISYNMPAYRLNGVLVYYAGYKSHIGFYPTASGIEAFKKELTGYKTSKGTIQFPLENIIPVTLVKDIVEFKVHENLEKLKAKKRK